MMNKFFVLCLFCESPACWSMDFVGAMGDIGDVNLDDRVRMILINVDRPDDDSAPTKEVLAKFILNVRRLNANMGEYLASLCVCPKDIGTLTEVAVKRIKEKRFGANVVQLCNDLRKIRDDCLLQYYDLVQKTQAEATYATARTVVEQDDLTQAFALVFDNPERNYKKELKEDYRSHFLTRHVSWINGKELQLRGTPYLSRDRIPGTGRVPAGHSYFEIDLGSTETIAISANGQRLTATGIMGSLEGQLSNIRSTSFTIDHSNEKFQAAITTVEDNGAERFSRLNVSCCLLQRTFQGVCVECQYRPAGGGTYIPVISKLYLK